MFLAATFSLLAENRKISNLFHFIIYDEIYTVEIETCYIRISYMILYYSRQNGNCEFKHNLQTLDFLLFTKHETLNSSG